MKLSVLFAAALCAACAASGAIQKPSELSSGDTLCFAGDSITHHGYYSKQIALYYITRFPQKKLNFRNAGIEGENAASTLARIDSDLRPDANTLFTLMLGMNDIRFGAEGNLPEAERLKKRAELFDIYKRNMTALSEKLRAQSKGLIILAPSIYDGETDIKHPITVGINGEILPKKKDVKTPARNKVLGEYAEYIKTYAAQNKIPCADLWTATNRANAAIHKDNPHVSVIGDDRVHPFDFGGLIMAAGFIKDVGETPVVSSAFFDAENPKSARANNCHLEDVKISKSGGSFKISADALPFPLTEKTASAAKYVDFQNSLNREILEIKNLDAGKYLLKIDGAAAGEYSAEELERGVNLAENPNTPQAAQVREVERLVELWRAKTQDFRNTFATELVFKLTSDDAANVAKINAAMNKKGASYYTVKRCKDYLLYRNRKDEDLKEAALAIDKAYKAAQPKTRFYSIEKK